MRAERHHDRALASRHVERHGPLVVGDPHQFCERHLDGLGRSTKDDAFGRHRKGTVVDARWHRSARNVVTPGRPHPIANRAPSDVADRKGDALTGPSEVTRPPLLNDETRPSHLPDDALAGFEDEALGVDRARPVERSDQPPNFLGVGLRLLLRLPRLFRLNFFAVTFEHHPSFVVVGPSCLLRVTNADLPHAIGTMAQRRSVPQILFTAFGNRDDAITLARDVGDRLRGEGVESSLHLLDVGDADLPSRPDLVVSLGGDGTFLKSARLAHAHDLRILAVNLGRVGFLLNVPASELLKDVRSALAAPQVRERLALEISLPGGSRPAFALNEVVVERPHGGHVVRVRSFVDDEEFLTYSADGVMVSTATGSTGYNFSAGGPVIDATLDVMVLTPVAPHFTIDRSIVVSGESVVRLESLNDGAEVVADGRIIVALRAGDSVRVARSPQPVRVVETRSSQLGFRLRESLREGHA